MDVVVDTNELIGVIIGKGRGRKTKRLDIFFSDEVNLLAPDVIIEELERNKEDVRLKAGFSEIGMEVFLETIESNIKKVSRSEYSPFLSKAKNVCPHDKDVMFFAVALKHNCKIWSEEERLKNQNDVSVVNTNELYEELFGKPETSSEGKSSDKSK